MSELVMNIKHQYYKNLFKLSCKLHAPVSEWAWKTVVYEKKNRDALYNAYQKDIAKLNKFKS